MPPICSGDEPLTTGLKSGLETEFPACVLSRLLLRCLASRAKTFSIDSRPSHGQAKGRANLSSQSSVPVRVYNRFCIRGEKLCVYVSVVFKLQTLPLLHVKNSMEQSMRVSDKRKVPRAALGTRY